MRISSIVTMFSVASGETDDVTGLCSGYQLSM